MGQKYFRAKKNNNNIKKRKKSKKIGLKKKVQNYEKIKIKEQQIIMHKKNEEKRENLLRLTYNEYKSNLNKLCS